MPIYEYECHICKKTFEQVSSQFLTANEDPGAECPDCNKVAPRISISQTSDPVFKSKGFYATDYKNKRS